MEEVPVKLGRVLVNRDGGEKVGCLQRRKDHEQKPGGMGMLDKVYNNVQVSEVKRAQ
jgi:hypothetical protein